MKFGSVCSRQYELNDGPLLLRRAGFWRYVWSDIKEARLHSGDHYEISFFSNLDKESVERRMMREGDELAWCEEHPGNVRKFGWTYNFLNELPLQLCERAARKIIARTGKQLLGLSIYSPEFSTHAQTY